MTKPVNVSEAQDQLLEIAFELDRIRQHLHHQFMGLRAEYPHLNEFYDAEEAPSESGPRSLELQMAEETDMAADQVEDLADQLRKAARLTAALIRQSWRVEQKERRS